MVSSYLKFKQNHNGSSDLADSASHFRLLLLGNTASALLWEELQVDHPVFLPPTPSSSLSPRGTLGTGAVRHEGAWPG